MKSLISGLMVAVTFIGGCSTVPRQEDVTGNETAAIVKRLRCEAGEALHNLTIELLRNPLADATEETRRLADEIENGTRKGTDLAIPKYSYILNLLTPRQKQIFEAYTLSAVTFDFLFNISESNLNTGTGGTAYPFAPNLFSLNLSATADFRRQSENRFQITNSFFSLHQEYDEGQCIDSVVKHDNIIYPITGKVGVDKTFRNFIGIDSQRTVYNGESKFSDQLAFTTTHNASLSPGLTLAQVPNSFKLTSLGAALSATRSDLHQVNIEIARGELPKGLSSRQALALVVAARRDAAARSLVNANQTRVQDLFIFPNRRLSPFIGGSPF